jgi:hypothetical protein
MDGWTDGRMDGWMRKMYHVHATDCSSALKRKIRAIRFVNLENRILFCMIPLS